MLYKILSYLVLFSLIGLQLSIVLALRALLNVEVDLNIAVESLNKLVDVVLEIMDPFGR